MKRKKEQNMGKKGGAPKKLETWDATRFKQLIQQTGVSYRELAKSCGISEASLVTYINGTNAPRMDNLMLIADYFAVPLDFLVGRMDRELADNLVANYKDCYMQIRRKDYECSVIARQQPNYGLEHGRGSVEAPYPYSLLDAIIGEFWDTLIEPDQEAAINYVISTFSEREQLLLDLYYKRGKTFDQCGKEVGVTRERVRQIIAKSLRRMRHPSRMNLIRYGLDGYEHYVANKKRRAQLEAEDRDLDELEQELIARRLYLESALECVSPVDEDKRKHSGIDIDEMNFSVRTFNCLRRANICTLNDLVQKASTDGYEGFTKVRNLGRKSIDEIYGKLEEYTGRGFHHYESLHNAYVEKAG